MISVGNLNAKGTDGSDESNMEEEKPVQYRRPSYRAGRIPQNIGMGEDAPLGIQFVADPSVTLNFRFRRLNYRKLVWFQLYSKRLERTNVYDRKFINYWTLNVHVRVRKGVTMGTVMRGMCNRFGLMPEQIVFCLDGFYGLKEFGDAKGKAGSCPWMEVTSTATVLSLSLQSGDSLYVSMPTKAEMQMANCQKEKMAAKAALF